MNKKIDIKKNPKWLIPLEDGKYKVIGRYNEYILEEKSGSVIDHCKRVSENTNGSVSMEALLVVRSLVEPKISEDDFEKLKGSDYLKLQAAITYVYGLDDFLQDEE